MSTPSGNNDVIVKVRGEEKTSVLKAEITVRLSVESPKGWLTIGGKGSSKRVTSTDPADIRAAKAHIIQDSTDIVRKCLWQADIALEKALNGELVDEIEDRRIHGVVLQGDQRGTKGGDSTTDKG